jgi:hypothetical protein
MSNNSGETKKEVPPEVKVEEKPLPMLLSPIPVSALESSESAMVSIAGVEIPSFVIRHIAKKHFESALAELLGVVVRGALIQGKPPEEIKRIPDFFEKLGDVAGAVLEKQLNFIIYLSSQTSQTSTANYQVGFSLIMKEASFTDESLRSFIIANIKAIKQQAEKEPDVVRDALKEVKEELKQLLAIAEQ